MKETFWTEEEDIIAETHNPPVWKMVDFKGDYKEHVWKNSILSNLTEKIERATNFIVSGRFSASPYQVTNYGLGGSCEVHMDPVSHENCPWGCKKGNRNCLCIIRIATLFVLNSQKYS